MSALAVHDLAVARGGRLLFAELSFAVAPGGALLVTGENGTGKSSLLRVLAGIARAAAGTVTQPGSHSWLGEQSALDPEQSLAAALLFWAKLDAAPDAKRRVAAALEETALNAIAELPVRLLSTGQRRRAAFARVVASGGECWLLDEPASGLDVAAVARLEDSIARHRAGGGIVVVATHQPIAMADAQTVAL